MTQSSNGAVSQNTCDRSPTAAAAVKLAIATPRSVFARRISACTATAAVNPAISLNGRFAVTQYSGVAIASATAMMAIEESPTASPPAARHHAAIANTPSAPALTLRSASDAVSEAPAACAAFASAMNTG
jgi:hypothetical protein